MGNKVELHIFAGRVLFQAFLFRGAGQQAELMGDTGQGWAVLYRIACLRRAGIGGYTPSVLYGQVFPQNLPGGESLDASGRILLKFVFDPAMILLVSGPGTILSGVIWRIQLILSIYFSVYRYSSRTWMRLPDQFTTGKIRLRHSISAPNSRRFWLVYRELGY